MKYRKLGLEKARLARKLYFVDDMTQKEVAKIIGCSQVNISLIIRGKTYREEKTCSTELST